MEQYPIMEIYPNIITENCRYLRAVCAEHGVGLTAVIKGYNAYRPITEAIAAGGFRSFASSRIAHLKMLYEQGINADERMLLRIPMQCELPEVIRYADVSLNSELGTLRWLNAEAARQGKIHKVILMRDVGDLREGFWRRADLVHVAAIVEKELKNLHLYGIGTNLRCYGSVLPSHENMGELAATRFDVEQRIGRALEIVSGGASTSIEFLASAGFPPGVNHLRAGEGLLTAHNMFANSHDFLPGLDNKAFIIRAQIVEMNAKPTYPVGNLFRNAFGNTATYVDRGIRKRALLGIGNFDVGNAEKLMPLDPGVQILGASSDHLIVDIEDSQQPYQLGGTMAFLPRYQAYLFATNNALVSKKIMA